MQQVNDLDCQTVTTRELARLLRLSTETIRDWRKLGKGPRYITTESAKRSGLVRYRILDVVEWLNRRTAHPRNLKNG